METNSMVRLATQKDGLRQRLALCLLLSVLLIVPICRAQTPPFTKLWKGEELWQFGGSKYAGAAGEWQSSPGSLFGFKYSGKGLLPKPIEFIIPIGQTLPLGSSYRLFVKNFYLGKMEVTLGDITKPLKIVRYDWTRGATFETNAAFDKIILRYFPSEIVTDTGKAQEQYYIVQGVFLTTETDKIPIEAGEIVTLLPQEQPALHAGNLLQNGSFEAGLYPWGKQFGISAVYDATNLDTTTVVDGKYSLRLPVSGPFGLETKMMRLPTNKRYTLSFYAKADAPLNLSATVRGLSEELKNYADGGLSLQTPVGKEWKRYSVTGKIKDLPGFLYTLIFEGKSQAPTTLWLDGLQLEEGALTNFSPSSKTEVGYLSHTTGNIFHEKEPAQVDLFVYSAAPQNEATVSYRIIDYWGREVDKGDAKIALADRSGRSTLSLYAGKRGIFRLLLTAGDSTSEMVYSVLPPNPHLTSKYLEGTLGVDTYFDTKQLAVLKRANFNWVISKFMARWYLVEPEKGRFVFDDQALQNADKAGMMVLLQPLNPDWGMQDWLKPLWKPKGGAAWTTKAEGMRAWGEFISRLTERYKPYVRYWEIENEPPYSAEEYAQLLKIARAAIKKADPDAMIVGFSGSGYSPDWFEQVTQLVGPQSFDVVSAHFYGSDPATHQSFAAFLKKYVKPGWNTETGTTCPSFFTTLLEFEALRQKDYAQNLQEAIHVQTLNNVQNYLTTLSLGRMEKYFYYFARFSNSGPSQPTRWGGNGKELVEYDGSLRANTVALSIASHFLDGAKYSGPAALDEGLEAHLYRKGEGAVGFAWAKEGRTLALTVPANSGLQFYDIMGNPVAGQKVLVGNSPVYFTTAGDGKAALNQLQVEAARK